MNEKLLLGVDEFSLVLFPQIQTEHEEWLQLAYFAVDVFLETSKIVELFGKLVEMHEKKPAAYSQAFTIENVPWYFALALHEYFYSMGILIHFSAEAWANYQKVYSERYNQPMNLFIFLKMVENPIYKCRLSRVDFTADYKNYNIISPHFVYGKLVEGDFKIVDHKGRTARKKLSALQNDFKTSTFYVGSRKENSKSLLRVYDKKQEQISQNGFRLDEALNCDSWTRFEVSFRGDYAHQITEQLVNDVHDEVELSQFIASKICDKYRFVDVYTGEYTDFTKDLLFLADKSDYSALRSENPQNNSLSKSIKYVIKGSGLYPLLYKIGQVWGKETEIEFLNIIYRVYVNFFEEEMQRNPQLNNWVKKNSSSLSKKRLLDCFVCETLSKKNLIKISEQPEQIFDLKIVEKKPDIKTYDFEEISYEEFRRLMYGEV